MEYKQAREAHDAFKWQEAMATEMNALTDNDTFELVPQSKDREVVGEEFKLISTFIVQNPKFFFMHVLTKYVLGNKLKSTLFKVVLS